MRQAVRAIIVQDGQLLVMKRNKYGQEYYTLIGGGVRARETPEQSLVREVFEESGLQATNGRLVFTEDAPAPFGTQLIYLCEYAPAAEVKLSPTSEEAAIHRLGSNLYTPMWLPIEQLHDVVFRTTALKYALLEAFEKGFPQTPQHIDPAKYHHAVHKKEA